MSAIQQLLAAYGAAATEVKFVASTNYSATANSATHVVDKPAGTVEGDLLVMFASSASSSLNPITCTGWTEIYDYFSSTSSTNAYVAYKVAGASEPSTYTLTPFNSRSCSVCVMTFRGASGLVGYTSAATASTVTSLDVSIGNLPTGTALVFCSSGASTSATSTPPTGFTELIDATSVGSSIGRTAVSYKTGHLGGATGNISHTTSSAIKQFNWLLAILKTESAISYVGGKTAGAAGQGGGSVDLTTGLTGGSGGAPLAGDLVVVTVAVGSAGRQPTIAISTPANYTPLTVQRTTATAEDTNVQTCYKIMGGTPDTAVTIPASGNSQDGIAYAIQVFRNVDPTTPLDATSTYATGSGTNNLPNPASITPVTPGAWIVACGGGSSATGANYAAAYLTNFLTSNGADNNDGTVGCGYVVPAVNPAAYDPAAFTGGSVSADNSWGATTLALRPK